jgi:hypothetical protein
MGPFVYQVCCLALAMSVASAGIGQTTDPSQQVAAILVRHGDPGGVSKFSGCSAASAAPEGATRQTTADELDLLSGNGWLTWKKIDGGYFVRLGGSNDRSLLDVKVPEIGLNTSDPVTNTGTLLANHVVQAEQVRLGLKILDRSIGFSALPDGASSRPEQIHFELPPGTLLEDLNRIAVRSGRAVWLHDEATCGGRRIASLNWIAR